MDVTKGILVTLIWATQGSQAVPSANGEVQHEFCGSDLNREMLFTPGVYKLEVSPGNSVKHVFLLSQNLNGLSVSQGTQDFFSFFPPKGCALLQGL